MAKEALLQKIDTLIAELENKVLEREELIRVMILAIFSKSHIFLVGPPGVGKTYIIGIIVKAIRGAKYFEYLIMDHTKPEEIFGEVYTDKEGNIVYNYENSVLDSHFVMLDEMFKGRSEILNALLGVTSNERVFYMRGRGSVEVPLITLFGASNEFPKDDVLEPFDDRLILRYHVERIKNPHNYKRLIKGEYDKSKKVSVEITIQDIEEAYMFAQEVIVPDHIADTFLMIKDKILQSRIKVSDRKMATAMNRILKMSAYLNGRNEVDYSDLFLLKHIAWNRYNNIKTLNSILNHIIFGSNKEVKTMLDKLEKDIERLEGIVTHDLGGFLRKTINVNAKNVTGIYNKYIEVVNNVLKNFKILRNVSKQWIEKYLFNKGVEQMIINNRFMLNIQDSAFRQEDVKKLYLLDEKCGEYVQYLEEFLRVCNDPFVYLKYIPTE